MNIETGFITRNIISFPTDGKIRYNFPEVPSKMGKLLLPRVVDSSLVVPGEPDRSVIEIWRNNGSLDKVCALVPSKKLIGGGLQSIEDFRKLRKRDGQIFFTGTAVFKDGKDYPYYPELWITYENSETGLTGNQGLHVFREEELRGKNFTPFDEFDNFLLRRVNDLHVLTKYKLEKKDGRFILNKIGAIDFRGKIQKWCQSLIGTIGPAIKMEDGRYLLPLHGVTKDEKGKPVYSLGTAYLDKDGETILHVDPEPLTTRRDHVDILPLGKGIHEEEREAIYSTDYNIESKNGLRIITFATSIQDTKPIEYSILFSHFERRAMGHYYYPYVHRDESGTKYKKSQRTLFVLGFPKAA